METKETNENSDIVLCPDCMTQNSPMTDFCQSCGYPLGQYVTVDPLKRIYSQGWLYRKAVSGRINKFGFWGMWIIFGSAIISILIFMILPGMVMDEGITLLWLYSFPLMIYIAILFRVTKNYLAIKRKISVAQVNDANKIEDEWVCSRCNATVEENATICPNCGDDVSEIEEDDLEASKNSKEEVS